MMVRAFALGLPLVVGGCFATGDRSDAGLMFGSGGPFGGGEDDGSLPSPDPPVGSESGSDSTSAGVDADTGTTGTTTGGMEDPTPGSSTDGGSTDEGSTGSTGSTETGELEEMACDQPPGAMTPAVIPDAQVGVPYEVTFSGPDGVYLYDWFTLVGAPPGLVLTSDSQPDTEATLSGIPTTAGSHDFIMIANPTGEDCVNADALIVEYTLEVDP